MRGNESSARRLAGAAARGIEAELLRDRAVAVRPGRRKLPHPWDVPLAEDWISEDVVVHIPPPRNEPGVLDVPNDLDFVHAVAGSGGADDVLFDHHTPHVVRAVRQTELTHFPALRHPGRLQIIEVVQDDAGEGERAKVV